MPYIPVHANWEDQPSTATPITGDALEAIEAGITGAYALGEAAVPKGILDAKGDLIVASAADTPSRLAVGADDTVPAAASGQATGIQWKKINNAMIASDAAIAASKLSGYPNDPSKTLLGDGSWGTVSAAPVGAITGFIANAPPTGWLMCDGAAISRVTYVALFNLIGVAFGAGDGSTTFNLPDLQGRMPVGRAPGGNGYVDALGDSEGAAFANRAPVHRTSMSDPQHAHPVWWHDGGNTGGGLVGLQGFGGLSGLFDASYQNTYLEARPASTGITVGPGGSYPIDTPAFLVINFIIKV